MVTQSANNRLKGTAPRLAGETRCGGWARVTCLHRLVVVCGYRRVGFAGRATPRASLQRVGSAGSILRTARPLDSPIVRTRKPDATKRRDKCQKCACMVLSLRSEQGQNLIPTVVEMADMMGHDVGTAQGVYIKDADATDASSEAGSPNVPDAA